MFSRHRFVGTSVVVILAATIAVLSRGGDRRKAPSPPVTSSQIKSIGLAVPQGNPIGVLVFNPLEVESSTNATPSISSNYRSSAPAWAVRYGGEFWRRPSAAPAAAKPKATGSVANLDIGDAIRRVQHALVQRSPAGEAKLQTATFEAAFTKRGLRFKPQPSAAEPDWDLPPDSVEVEFRTSAIRRGPKSTTLVDSPQNERWHVHGNTAQTPLSEAPGIVEHHEMDAQGVAVTWVFAAAPFGSGPLEIDTEVTGGSYAGQTATGHHFADTAGVARIRVGQATAVDSHGQRWPLLVAANGSGLQVTVPESVLLAAAYPLAIDPWVSPEFGMDNPVVAPSPYTQQAPRISRNGSIYLVAWFGLDAYLGVSRESITGVRVDASGEVLDPEGIPIADDFPGLGFPALAPAGNGFLAVWNHGDLAESHVRGRFISQSGQPGNAFPIGKAAPNTIAAGTTVAAGGGLFLVAWEQGGTVRACRVSSEGAILGDGQFRVATSLQGESQPAVAFNGQDFLVVWRSFANDANGIGVHSARVNTSGVTLDPVGVPLSVTPGFRISPAVASFNGEFLVAWNQSAPIPATDTGDIVGCRVSAAGTRLDPDGIDLAVQPGRQDGAALSASETGYLIAWADRPPNLGEKVMAARVTSGGVVLDPGGVKISGPGENNDSPAIAPAANGFFVAWRQDYGVSGTDIAGAFVPVVGDQLKPGSPFYLSLGSNLQFAPAVSSNGQGYLVTWQDNRNQLTSGTDVYGVRLAPDGTVLDPNGIAIAVAPGTQASPAVGTSGLHYLVAWRHEKEPSNGDDDIHGRILDATGAWSGAFPICTVTNSQRAPSVAGDGKGFLVVWRDDRSADTTVSDIYGARVSLSGEVDVDDGFPIGVAMYSQQAPTVASNGSGYLVAWRDSRNILQGVGDDIYGALVGSSDGVGDAIPISQAPGLQRGPDIAANGSTYLVAWRDDREQGVTPEIVGTRVTAEGVVLSPQGVALSSPSDEQREPALAAAGDGWFVIWYDFRNGGNGWEVFGAQISPAGTPVPGTDGRLVPGGWNFEVLSLAGRGNGEFVVVSENVSQVPRRVAGRLIQIGEAPPTLRIARQGSAVRLHWALSPRFPAKGSSVQGSVGFGPWNPLPDSLQPKLVEDGLTAELDVPVGPANNSGEFFRLHSD